MKVFIGPVDFGWWKDIANKLEKRGHEVIYLGACSHPGYAYRYQAVSGSATVKCIEYLYSLRNRTGRVSVVNSPLKAAVITLTHVLSAVLFIELLARGVDHFIYVAGRSLLPGQFDLLILKALDKRVIAYLSHGGDSRPPYLDGRIVPVSHPSDDDLSRVYRLSKRQSKCVGRATRWASIAVVNRFHAQFSMRPFVEFFSLLKWGNTDISGELDKLSIECPAKLPNVNSRPVKIMHVPSFPAGKGSDEIQRAIDLLKSDGFKIDYEVVTGVSHREVIRRLASVDLVIDQLYSDVPLASLASEATVLEVPVVVAGYELSYWVNQLDSNIYPNVICHPDDLYRTLNRMISEPECLPDLREKIKYFLDAYGFDWTVNQIEKLLDGSGEFDLIDPKELNYFMGIWLSESRLGQFLVAYYDRYGVEGFIVNEKQKFLDAILGFVNIVRSSQSSKTIC